MKRYLFNRIITLIPTLLIVATVGYLLIYLTPGCPAAVMLGDEASTEDVLRLRTEMGLDEPLFVQLGRWYSRLLRGDLGYSFFLQRTVWRAIGDRLETTLLLTAYSMLIAVLLGIVIGIVAAVKHNTIVDQAMMGIALLGVSMPSFWLAINLIWIFALGARWLPAAGYVPLAEGFVPNLRSIALPAVTLGFIGAAPIARMVRSSMLEVLNQDYIRTARAKGLREVAVIVAHGFRNALIPTTTMIGMTVGSLISGAIVVETVFALPGVGRLVIQSIGRRDYPTVQGVLVFIAAIYVIVNLLVDVLYLYLDPRVKYL
jgi:peptide/nickel transport system permease protein